MLTTFWQATDTGVLILTQIHIMKKIILSLLTIGALALESSACGGYGLDLESALDGNDREIAALAESIRSRGDSGLEEVLAVSRAAKSHPKYHAFLDQVAKQRDAAKSRLFWHTDFDKALAHAKATERPVLSLRLLGNLDEEYSCANSRLFREVLYSDPKVSDFLRANFVLHWKSVRPVPVMTIDFGDGRTLKRTITGNSAHYILDSRGRVFDALPGLYTAEKFLVNLQAAAMFNDQHDDDCSRSRPSSLVSYHKRALARLEEEFNQRLETCKISKEKISTPIEMTNLTAAEWSRVATTSPSPPQQKLAAKANALTTAKCVTEVRLIDQVEQADLEATRRTNLRKTTAEDSVRNEFVFHRRVHEAFATGSQKAEIESLNRWVYNELFLMPDNDPWLGLHTPEHFTGLTNNGASSN